MTSPSTRRRRQLATACLGSALLLATACTAPGTSSEQGDTVKLGAILPVTGPVSEWGESNSAVLELFEDEVNEAGGVGGKTLEIIIEDSGAEPAEAANLVRRLASEDEVIGILGPFTSSEAEVAFPVANQLEVPITAQASSKPGVAEANRPWAFRNTIDEGTYLSAVVPAVEEDASPKRAAIAYDSADAVGTSIGTAILPEVLGESGMEVVNGSNPVTFKTADIDLKSQVSALVGSNADVIGVGAFYNGASKLLREMSNRGANVPIFGGSTLVSANILDAAPNTPIYSAGTYFPGAEPATEWTEKIQGVFDEKGVPGSPTMFDAQLYEIAQMYVEAIEEGDLVEADVQTARTGIRDYMTELDGFEGLTTPISMQETGDVSREFFVIKGVDGEWSRLDSATP